MKAELQQQDGLLKLVGALDFHSVADLLGADASWLNGDEIAIDLAEITQTNSAGLALLLEWMKMAQQKGFQIKYHSVPEQLLVIARAYGVDQDLPIV